MKNKFLHFIVMFGKFSIYYLVLHALLINVLSANESKAQRVLSVKEARISLQVEDATLEKTFRLIEKNSEYVFVFNKKALDNSVKIKFDAENQTVESLLLDISKQAHLGFRQVNNRISVKGYPTDNIEVVIDQQTIKGRVTDEKGEGLPGATVLIRGTTTGTVTDVEGRFSLDFEGEPEQVLVVSFLGYLSQEIVLNGQTEIDVSLKPDLTNLQEVVVIGYGTQKKADVTGAIATFDASKTLKERPIQRVDQALVGQMAGVRVVQSSGVPGQGFSIQVRGTGSITGNNQPLYVIDGFPLEVTKQDENGTFNNGNPLDNINPNDIESIQVLKDAAAAAIYGSRAANGVVLITTKTGRTGKATINFNTYFGWSETAKKLDILSAEEWVERATEMINDTYVNGDDGTQNRQRTDDTQTRMNNLGVTEIDNSNFLDERWAMPGHPGLEYIDWQDEFFRKGSVQSYQITASGGTQNVKYFVSGDYLDQEGIAYGVGYERFSARANIEVQATDKLSFGLNINPSYGVASDPGVEGKDQQMHLAVSLSPVSEELVGIDVNVGDNQSYFWGNSRSSPVRVAQNAVGDKATFRTLATSWVQYQLIDGLALKTSFNFDNADQDWKEYTPGWVTRGRQSSGRFRSFRRQTFVNENTISYNKSFGGHGLSLVAGTAYNYNQFGNQDIRTTGDFNVADIQTLNQATIDPSNTLTEETKNVLISYFGRAQYNFKDRYLLSASIRRDGSSKFGPNTKWGVFPAVSVGWRVSEEAFLQGVTPISDLKVRASWGLSGNTPVNDYEHVSVLEVAHYTFGGAKSVGLRPENFPFPDLGWEESSTIDFGLDLGVLDNRIYTSFDIYKRTTSNLLLSIPVPTATGFTTGFTNIGEVENTGWEWELTSHNLTGPVNWTTSINLSHNENKVLQLGPENTPIPGGAFDITHNLLTVGEPMYSVWVVQADGILSQADIDGGAALYGNQQEGDAKYVDQLTVDTDGDGIPDATDGVITPDDRVISGHPNPDLIYGITNSVSFKGFDLSVFVQGQTGGSIYSTFGRAMDRTGQGYSDNKIGIDRERWTTENPNFNAPRGKATSSFGRIKNDDWLYSSDYIRIRNITLGYSLDKLFNNVNNIQGGRIYVTAENWFGKDKYHGGFNPEAINNSGDDYGAFPLAKSMIFGLNLTF